MPNSTFQDSFEQDNLTLNDYLEKILFDDSESNEAFLGKRFFESNAENTPATKHRRLDENSSGLSQQSDALDNESLTPIQNCTIIFQAKTKVLSEKGRALIRYVIANREINFREKACAIALNYRTSQVSVSLIKAFSINGQTAPSFKVLMTYLVGLTSTDLEELKESIKDPSPQPRQPRKNTSQIINDLDYRLKKINLKHNKYQEFLSAILFLGYNEHQANRIIVRKSSSKTCEFLIAHHNVLYAVFKNDIPDSQACYQALTKIASHDGGIRNLLALKNNYEAIKALGFSAEQLIRILGNIGGSRNLAAVINSHQKLTDLGFTEEQITRMVSRDGGSHNLLAVKNNYHERFRLHCRANYFYS